MMVKKFCQNCRVTAWHNSCAAKDRGERCTYCGYPAGGNSTSDKKAYQTDLAKRQANRARLLGITEV